MEYFVEHAKTYAQTADAMRALGKRVLCKNGEVLGKVRELRLDASMTRMEGVVVSKSRFGKVLYICHTYIARITPEAVLLKIDPATTFVGRAVVTTDGKKFGKAIGVTRVKDTEEIESFLVRRRLIRKLTVPGAEFSKLGTSLILKKTYDKAKIAYTE